MLVSPIAAMTALVLFTASAADEVAPPEDVVTAHARKESFQDSVDVEVSLTWNEAETLVAPAWSGLVTAVADLSDGSLASGDRVAQVDGVWRLAAHTPRPFHSAVSEIAPAAEIGMLNSLLADLGFQHAEGGRWDWNTVLGVRSLAKELGVPNADSAPGFDPSWVVWMPRGTFHVADSLLVPGSPAPAVGAPVVEGDARLGSATITAMAGAVLPDPELQWDLLVGEIEATFSGSDMTTEESAALGTALADGQPETVSGVLRRHDPVDGWAVPAASVVTDARGELCLVVVSEDGTKKYRAIPVETLGGAAGTIRVSGALPQNTEIVANPGRVLDDFACS
ncbi:UNVERIFIED_CONTAM: hypothetical protein OHV15_06415 [Microbacterium sp. SLM126]